MNTRDIIALSMVKGIGNAFIKKNINQIVMGSSVESFVSSANIEVDDSYEPSRFLKRADSIIKECQDKGYKIVNISESSYPASLKAISDPPAVLYMLGEESLLEKPVAIIGTRHSSNLGNRIAERLGKHFSNHFSICNGLVEGIDEHAIYVDGHIIHNAVGVISGGLNYTDTCTASHAAIIKDVLDAGGLIVSEFEPTQKEDQFSGSKVSRIQAGLSLGLILVQSSIDGGSKYTIKAFGKLNRTLGVVHFPSNEEYKTDSFSANREIVENGYPGIAKLIGLKSTTGLVIKDLVIIESQKDYALFKAKIEEAAISLW